MAVRDTWKVVIHGARQTDKATLARLVMSEYLGSELGYLDEAPRKARLPIQEISAQWPAAHRRQRDPAVVR